MNMDWIFQGGEKDASFKPLMVMMEEKKSIIEIGLKQWCQEEARKESYCGYQEVRVVFIKAYRDHMSKRRKQKMVLAGFGHMEGTQ